MSQGNSNIHHIYSQLRARYVISMLGNKKNPLDEMFYIMISGQTFEKKYEIAYKNLKKQFPRWDILLETSISIIRRAIWSAGLSNQKSKYIKQIALKLKHDFGIVSLRSLKHMDTSDAEEYLISLPGVGVKTARCILMYSLDRKVFPADIHCYRIMDRLGWINWKGDTSRKIANDIQNIVPPRLRRNLHILLVQHGRNVCKSKPNCLNCFIRDSCTYFKRQQNIRIVNS